MVDPNKNSILFFGSRNSGLWKSIDYGATWVQVAGFPATGQSNLGIGWVTFDPSTGSSGSATQTIYAGVIDTATPVYKTTDGGSTWTARSMISSARLTGARHGNRLRQAIRSIHRHRLI